MDIKYKLFKIWKKQQYKKFLKERNWDFDHSSITQFLDLKLTIMGLYFAKFGKVVDVDRKQQVRTIWQTRKYLRNYENAFDITYVQCQKKFREKYGVDYEFDLISTPIPADPKFNHIKFVVTSNVPNKDEAEAYWLSLNQHSLEYLYGQDNLRKALETMNTHLRTWWD